MASRRLVAISGSLRRGSYNTAAARAALEVLPEGWTGELVLLHEIPPYNEDVRTEQGYPPAVARLRETIRAADALLIVSPEYNYSIPGVLKNAIDWVSRPPQQPLADKPVATMGASPGAFGTVRMQPHLRFVLASLGAQLLWRPDVLIRDAGSKFDDSGRLVDSETREQIARLVEALCVWSVRLEQGR
jgi:chromate reductase